jgi:PAS domain S-box-containing protein
VEPLVAETPRTLSADALRLIVEGTASVTGECFFCSLVRHLAQALRVDFAFVGALLEDGTSIETLAAWHGGKPLDTLTLQLAGTPCETVVGNRIAAYPSGVRERFPNARLLRELGLESYVGAPLFDSDGAPLGLVAVLDTAPMEEIAAKEAVLGIFAARAGAELERLRAERELREANERFRLAANALEGVVYDWDVRADHGYLAEGFAEVFGYELDEVESTHAWWLDRIHPADRPSLDRTYATAVESGDKFLCEYRFRAADGRYRHVLDRAVPVRSPDGRAVRMVGVVADVTERRDLERQLRQAQKLEALGQLAGGVAHDFNNILSVITGYAELLVARLEDDTRGRHDAEEILRASRRAADLTRQLLAYSRRQRLQPGPIDVGGLLEELAGMLRRLIGEQIRLVCRPDRAVGQILADRSQLEQVIVNLAVNARDAMPTGGVLSIEADNVDLPAGGEPGLDAPPGPYLRLTVADTGTGMDDETRARIFEPFFTTKGSAGTGLGLATVYGIVGQSGGRVTVESHRDRGTTFRLYFPRVGAPRAVEPAVDPPRAAVRRAPERGRETVLVAEDDATILSMLAEVLTAHGYSVLAATSGAGALELLEQGGADVDLLLTDMTMPELTGPELAARATCLAPRLRILYMSGDTNDAAPEHGPPLPGDGFLEKPFPLDTLLALVREVLDRPVEPRATQAA